MKKLKSFLSKLAHLLRQRRVWAAIVGFGTFALGLAGTQLDTDAETLTNMLHTIGESAAGLIAGLLALWSYLYPKK